MRYAKIGSYVPLGITGAFLLLAIIDAIRLRMGETSLFGGILTIMLLAVAALALVVSLFIRKPTVSVYGIGYYLMHGGLMLFLLGSFIYGISGVSITTAVPIDRYSTYSQIQSKEGEIVSLGFDVGVSDFKMEQYSIEEDGVGGPKFYEATLMIQAHNGGDLQTKPLIVNKPVRENGWQILLMGYSSESNTATLMFKKDQGEWISQIGIWTSIIGAFLMCFIRKRKVGEHK